MKTKLLTFFLLILASLCYAQQTEPDKKVWTLQECVEYAYRNNIEVKQQELTVLNNQLTLRQSNYNRLPGFNASTSLTNSVGRSVDPFTNDIINQDINSQSYGINGEMTL